MLKKEAVSNFDAISSIFFDTIVKKVYHLCLAVKRQKFLQFQ